MLGIHKASKWGNKIKGPFWGSLLVPLKMGAHGALVSTSFRSSSGTSKVWGLGFRV